MLPDVVVLDVVTHKSHGTLSGRGVSAVWTYGGLRLVASDISNTRGHNILKLDNYSCFFYEGIMLIWKISLTIVRLDFILLYLTSSFYST